jgi:hypothetical protein
MMMAFVTNGRQTDAHAGHFQDEHEMKRTTMRKTPRLLLGLALLSVAVGAAQAETVGLRYAGTASVVATALQLPVQTDPASYYVGSYNIQEDGGASFLAYCSDPAQWASSAYQPYEKTTLADHLAAPALRADVERLFGHAYQQSLLAPVKAAGFALALWEVWRDDRNLDTGIVHATTSTDAAVRAEAQTLLDVLPFWTTTGTPYQLTVYANYTSATEFQDYISATPIPEPETYALMLAGLGLLGTMGRRCKAAR